MIYKYNEYIYNVITISLGINQIFYDIAMYNLIFYTQYDISFLIFSVGYFQGKILRIGK